MRPIQTPNGFTMVELLVVIALLATLSAMAFARPFKRIEFEKRLFLEEVRAALGYAQKLAVATGCTVEVDFTLGAMDTLTLNQPAADPNNPTSCPLVPTAFNQPVPHPAGSGPYVLNLPEKLVLTVSNDPLRFDARGRVLDNMGNVLAATTIDLTDPNGDGSQLAIDSGEIGYFEVTDI